MTSRSLSSMSFSHPGSPVLAGWIAQSPALRWGFAVGSRQAIRRALLCAIRRRAIRWGKCESNGFAELCSAVLDSRINLGLRRAQLCGWGFAVGSRQAIRRALLCAIRRRKCGGKPQFTLYSFTASGLISMDKPGWVGTLAMPLLISRGWTSRGSSQGKYSRNRPWGAAAIQ